LIIDFETRSNGPASVQLLLVRDNLLLLFVRITADPTELVEMSSSELVNYEMQLQQVESALSFDAHNEELLKLKSDLNEVIQLTKSLMGESSSNPSTSTASGSGKAGAVVHSYRSGDPCMAPWSEDGQFYEAIVEDVTSDGQCTVVFHMLPNGKHRVNEVCLLSLLKPSATQRKKSAKHGTVGVGGKADPQQQRDQIKKKQQKKQSRFKELEDARERDKCKWKQFNQKAIHKHLKGASSMAKKQSIFKSPETVEGKVGVGTCGIGGRPMTNFVVGDKYKRGTLSADNLPSNITASMNTPSTSSAPHTWYRKP
jgi:survival-of-motor-neuron-related-splicing factor 30